MCLKLGNILRCVYIGSDSTCTLSLNFCFYFQISAAGVAPVLSASHISRTFKFKFAPVRGACREIYACAAQSFRFPPINFRHPFPVRFRVLSRLCSPARRRIGSYGLYEVRIAGRPPKDAAHACLSVIPISIKSGFSRLFRPMPGTLYKGIHLSALHVTFATLLMFQRATRTTHDQRSSLDQLL